MLKAQRIEEALKKVFQESSIDIVNDSEAHRGHAGYTCLLYTSPSPRDVEESRMPSSA